MLGAAREVDHISSVYPSKVHFMLVFQHCVGHTHREICGWHLMVSLWTRNDVYSRPSTPAKTALAPSQETTNERKIH